MAIKCGNCHEYHETVADVRVCFTNKAEFADRVAEKTAYAAREAEQERAAYTAKMRREEAEFGGLAATFPARRPASDRPRYGRGGTYVTSPTARPSTDRQQAFIASLRAERGLEPLAFTGTTKQASAEIDRLKDLPVVAKDTTSPNQDVPAGRYALEDDGVVKFYRVDRPTEGKWAGRTFVKVQASDEFHPLRGAGATAVLAQIGMDPRAASLLYGRELGHCGVCGRTLTDEASRAAGIGPVCAAGTGW